MYKLFYVLVISVPILFLGCSGSSRTVKRVGVNEVRDLSGRWNDTDARLVAEEMVKSFTSGGWVQKFIDSNGKTPIVIVGSIRNQSNEHIDTDVFIKDLEKEVINNGVVKFVANKTERADVREERTDQQNYSSEETAKKLANETGADFMLKGSISTITDAAEDQAVKFYQVDLELINLENNEKVWIGSKKLKKVIEKSDFKW